MRAVLSFIEAYALTCCQYWGLKRIDLRQRCRVSWVIPVSIRPYHLKFLYYFERLSHIERQWLECLIDEDFTLFSYLVLRDKVQVDKRFVQESSDVLDLLKDLWVVANFDELDKLLEYLLNRSQFISVCPNQVLLIH